jgi:hypothetical protein
MAIITSVEKERERKEKVVVSNGSMENVVVCRGTSATQWNGIQ